MSVILIERQCFGGQTSWTAHDRFAFPLALACLAGMRRVGEIEIHIVDNDQIQKSVAIEIEERATCAPARLGRSQPPLLGFVIELAIAKIPIENVLSPLRDKQIRISVIVYIADTDTLSPSGKFDSRLVGDVFEFQSTQIAIKEMLWLDGAFVERP